MASEATLAVRFCDAGVKGERETTLARGTSLADAIARAASLYGWKHGRLVDVESRTALETDEALQQALTTSRDRELELHSSRGVTNLATISAISNRHRASSPSEWPFSEAESTVDRY